MAKASCSLPVPARGCYFPASSDKRCRTSQAAVLHFAFLQPCRLSRAVYLLVRPPFCNRELVLVNVEDCNMITESLMKLNHFCFKADREGECPSGSGDGRVDIESSLVASIALRTIEL